jgi:hypothetical protein
MLSANMQRWIIPKVIALLSSFVLFTPLALADTTCLGTRTAAQPQMAEQLDSFERGAALTRDQIDHYAAAVRNGNPHRDSHAVNLNLARQNVKSWHTNERDGEGQPAGHAPSTGNHS